MIGALLWALPWPSAIGSERRSLRGDIDGDSYLERIFTAPAGQRGSVKLKISDVCRGRRITRTVSGSHEALMSLRLVAADTRRGRELLFDLRDGASARTGEAGLVAWRRTGKGKSCRAPRNLLRYSARRPTRRPSGAQKLSGFTLRVRRLNARFAGREAVLTERFTRSGDAPCCPSVAKHTFYRYSRKLDRYRRYRTAIRRTPRRDASMTPGDGTRWPAGSTDPVIAAAGDIACDPLSGSYNGGHGTSTACRHRHTSDLLLDAGLSGVLTLGDNQYEDGQLSKFHQSYSQTWGRAKAITYPTPGNHEYRDPAGQAQGYFDYFGSAAGGRGAGYYSFDIGSWHLIALNSNCSEVGGCGPGSAQEEWLRQDLQRTRTSCVLAYWHHPRFSSGLHGDTVGVQRLWEVLYDAGADVVLSGHDHTYERFAPQDPTGVVDATRGIRQFVVGTGGHSLYPFVNVKPNSEVRNNTTFGVLKLSLHPSSYEWRFEPEAARPFRDEGTAPCH